MPDKPLNTSYTVCVFCGSSSGSNPAHMQLAKQLGKEIAMRGDRLVYGGGGLGLMGAAARAAHENGAHVLGIIPEFLSHIEKTFTDADYEIVENMHHRKSRMYSEADAFIVLPGGIGTLEEAIEVLSWQRLNLHQKPIIFLSDTHYWDAVLASLSQIIDDGFAPASFQHALLSASTVEHAYDLLSKAVEQPLLKHKLHQAKDESDEN
ncbi:MAG: TIGR00730 family Rossman fold protein [Litorimonas sp.]